MSDKIIDLSNSVKRFGPGPLEEFLKKIPTTEDMDLQTTLKQYHSGDCSVLRLYRNQEIIASASADECLQHKLLHITPFGYHFLKEIQDNESCSIADGMRKMGVHDDDLLVHITLFRSADVIRADVKKMNNTLIKLENLPYKIHNIDRLQVEYISYSQILREVAQDN